MMTQPASAASAPGATLAGVPVLAATSAEAGDGAGDALPIAPGGTNAALFSQALLALIAGTEPAATDPAGLPLAAAPANPAGTPLAGVGAALVTSGSRALRTTPGADAATASVPATAVDGADALPRDLLLALFAAEATASVPGRAPKAAAPGGSDDARSFAAVLGLPAGTTNTDQTKAVHAAPADPGAALLAAVLQWLQQQHAVAGHAEAATSLGGDGRESAAGASTSAAAAVAATTTAAIADNSPDTAGTGRADGTAPGAAVADAMSTAASGATLSSELGARRDGDERAASNDQPRTAAMAADSTGSAGAASGAGAVMDMASALRAASAATPAAVERSVTVPVHERHWPTALATQVLVLSNDRVQAATLRLSPEHLGPVEVRIDMQESSVNVSFTAAHAETRAALEQAMPQLRAVLAGAGLSLGQATVQQQARRESQNSSAATRAGSAADEPLEAPAAVARALGMIDEYV